jgi:catechol 2,3-dioxygenase-like lactoylglutathione lyase family enzyme
MSRRLLDHASVRIGNLERSRQFYEGILGFTPAPRPDFGFPGMWYDLGEGQLHLIQNAASSAHIDPTNPHFAIVVDDFEALRRRLQEAGVEMLDFGGGEQFWILDPDGNTVELRAAPARAR